MLRKKSRFAKKKSYWASEIGDFGFRAWVRAWYTLWSGVWDSLLTDGLALSGARASAGKALITKLIVFHRFADFHGFELPLGLQMTSFKMADPGWPTLSLEKSRALRVLIPFAQITWRLDCLLNCLFKCRSKKTSKLRATGLYEGNPPVIDGFPSQRASHAENVSMT